MMNEKPTLVYVSPDYYTQVDDTVLPYLTRDFRVVWVYLYESLVAGRTQYDPDKARAFAEQHGLELIVWDQCYRRRDLRNVGLFRRLARRINTYKPAIVYCCVAFPFWTYAYSALKCPCKVYGAHDVLPHSRRMNPLLKFYYSFARRSMKRFAHVFTFSRNQHDLLLEKYGRESEMVGMSIKSFGESALTPGPLSEGVRILFFGVIKSYKGLDLLIAALEELFASGVRNVQLTIAGTGYYWDACQALIRTPSQYDLQVRFIDNAEIPDLMSSHHFLALPYRDATQSGPLVAALGYGLPVIAPRFGVFTEVFDDDTAVLYEPGDVEGALRRVAAMPQATYDALRGAVADLREQYTEEAVAENYIRAFKKLINS